MLNNCSAEAEGKMANRQSLLRFSEGVLASCLVFALINCLGFRQPESIADGWYFHGFPFTFYRHGGFTHERAYLWSGLLADLAIMVAVGFLVGWVWNSISERLFSKNREY
jgi:hypothetical protein